MAASLLMVGEASAQDATNPQLDSPEMAAARARLKAGHGGQHNSLLLGERFEYLFGDEEETAVWEAQGWYGSDLNKLWLKTEGEYSFDESELEDAELQALYSRAVSPFWDLQTGLRYDDTPDASRSYWALGMQGLAPYWFEVDAALFLSDEGNLSSRLEAEYELRLTQRLILQPRLELNVAFSDDTELEIGSGVSGVELGLRLRYEIRREFAPYLGVAWSSAYGGTRDFIDASGGEPEQFSLIAGLRFWY